MFELMSNCELLLYATIPSMSSTNVVIVLHVFNFVGLHLSVCIGMMSKGNPVYSKATAGESDYTISLSFITIITFSYLMKSCKLN